MNNENSSLPLVSIIIPAFNADRWIAACLESALIQTYPNTEIIVADDCSMDRTVEIALQYNDPRVCLIKSEKNLGMAANWNFAIRATKGEFILKLDADDILDPRYLEQLVPVLRDHPQVSFATCDFDIIDIDANHIRTERRMAPLGIVSGRNEFLRYVQANRARGTCVLLRRDSIFSVGGYDMRFQYNGDWWLYLNLLLVGDVYYSDMVLASYRVHMVEKTQRPLWEAKDHLLAWYLLPTIWPEDLPNCEFYLRKARRRFATALLTYSYFEASPEMRPQLLELVLEHDQSVQTKFRISIARSRIYPILSWPRRIKTIFKRWLKVFVIFFRKVSTNIR